MIKQIITVFSLLFIGIVINHAIALNLQYEPVQPLLPLENLDPEKVKLGSDLFHDPILSLDNDMSCVSCHQLSDNGADHKAHTIGRNNIPLMVNTLTVFNSSLNHRQFWDGRAWTLEEQIDFVLANDMEFASNWTQVIKKLKQSEQYVREFKKIYKDGINPENIRNAIATFERTLITTNSRFDQYLLGDNNAINLQEKQGYQLFKSYGCVACHQGRNVGGNMFMKFGVFGSYYSTDKPSKSVNLGRYNISGDANDRYVFRVPSLRLAVITAPYFHDGSVKTLPKAIQIMAKYQLGRTISEEDINSIIAFLETLPGEYMGTPLYVKQKNTNNRHE